MIPIMTALLFPFWVRDPPFGYIRNAVWRRRVGLAIVLLYGAIIVWLLWPAEGPQR
jgi:hypothetical protein